MGSLSANTEEYLEALERISAEGRAPTVKELSALLRVSPASVSEMLRKLAAAGFVEYKRYKKIALTEKGKKEGSRVLRKHRLIEKFLKMMGIKKERLHTEACLLEHVMSDELEEALRAAVSENKEGTLKRLSLMRPGECGKIALVAGGKAARDRLMEMGLTPGAKIIVRHTSTRHGPMEICVRSSYLAVGKGIAEKILVDASK